MPRSGEIESERRRPNFVMPQIVMPQIERMIAMTAEFVSWLLDDAATHLLAVGCGNPDRVDAVVRLRCLWAVEELRGIGAHARRDLEPGDVDDVPGVIEAALSALDRVAGAPDTDASVAATVRAVVEKMRGPRW
jgi:hypothetical protein